MREILFRGKRIDNSEWETGSLVYARMGTSEEQVGIADKMTAYHTPVIPETVGQYTGLKDLHGKCIFEGDIVACNQSGSYGISVIIYDNSAFYVMPLNGNILERTLWDYWYNDWDIEVISNIHDSTELLEVKEHE